MADLIYMRHSTDKQTDTRQRHALAALLSAGVPVYDDPATSSRVLSVDRAGFSKLLDAAAVGDTIHIADAARLFRSVADVLALRPVLSRRGLHLRVASGLLSGIDLAADDPGTKMVVNVLAAVLEFQRDMISENTREGVAAAEASGKTLGRPAVLDEDQAADVVKAHREGAAVKALARQYGTSPKTIRRVLDTAGARSVPVIEPEPVDQAETAEVAESKPDRVHMIDVPGKVADFLEDTDDTDIRAALKSGSVIRRGAGYSVRVTAPLSVFEHMRSMSWVMGGQGTESTPAERKAYRAFDDRIEQARTAF